LQDIKYLAFSPSDIGRTLPDIRGDWLGFTTVPVGNWNVGYLGKNAETSKLDLQHVGRVPIERVEDVWHPTRVDISVLGEPTAGYPELQCTGQMYSAIYQTQSNASSIVVNTEWYPDSIYGVIHETHIYSLIEGLHIGPKFLGHITENHDRVYGYMLEKLAARSATMGDIEACRKVLSKLKIAYGSLHKQSFLIVDGQAFLHCFGGSNVTSDQTILNTEMNNLEAILQQQDSVGDSVYKGIN
jgi:hypothetical protein